MLAALYRLISPPVLHLKLTRAIEEKINKPKTERKLSPIALLELKSKQNNMADIMQSINAPAQVKHLGCMDLNTRLQRARAEIGKGSEVVYNVRLHQNKFGRWWASCEDNGYKIVVGGKTIGEAKHNMMLSIQKTCAPYNVVWGKPEEYRKDS